MAIVPILVFQGVTIPIQDLYTEIHMRGWQVQKVDTKNGSYEATVKNPHGESVTKVGPNAETALAAVLHFILRREFIRQGAWQQHWTHQLAEIAQAYAKAPVFDPKAAGAWHELGQDCVARAEALGQQLKIEVVNEPDPYHDPKDMWKDIQKGKLKVTRANSDHPLWSEQQVLAYRIVHDVLGHAAGGGDFGWTGDNLATAAHMPYLSPSAQAALFSEAIGHSAYRTHFKGFGPKKIVFLNEFLQPAQKENNPDGHGGEPVKHTLTPGSLPKRKAGVKRDPNFRYETGIIPPAINAVNNYGDPLDHMGTLDMAHKLNTGWAQFTDSEGKPDHVRMKAAIVNAFRAALLSPMKPLKWNAVHYQDISHIPHNVSDPKVYWNALETARINHNRAQGALHPEIQHKAHYESLLGFYRYYHKLHPEMSPSESKENADKEVLVMQSEIEQDLMNESPNPDMDIFEPKVFKLLDKRLKEIVKDERPLGYTLAIEPTSGGDLYGGFIGRHLISIAQISRYADLLLESALEDVKNHDGAGHMFRQTALSLDILYVGPKIVSFVWLLLQPLTSQLATLDTHMHDVLGYKQGEVAPRDYYRMERELQAGRDALGYSHVPLGQYQWSMWDNKRTGDGSHQDHSALRPVDPQAHHTIDWTPPMSADRGGYIPPEWWQITEPYRQNEVAAWNTDVAPYTPKGQIPWQDNELPVHIASIPNIIPVDTSHPLLSNQDWMNDRLPFIYLPKSNTVYVGNQGTHHGNIRQMLEQTGNYLPDGHEGMIFTNPDTSLADKNIQWWREPPQHREIGNAILTHPNYKKFNWGHNDAANGSGDNYHWDDEDWDEDE